MKILVLKNGNSTSGDIVEILDSNHVFSPKELSLFNFVEVEDEKVDQFNKEISEYQMTNQAIGGEPLNILKYYDGTKLVFR